MCSTAGAARRISGFFGLEAHHKPLSTLSQLYSACLQVEVVLAGRGRLRLICAAPQQQRCGRLVPAQLVELLLLRTTSACRFVPSDIFSMQRHADAQAAPSQIEYGIQTSIMQVLQCRCCIS